MTESPRVVSITELRRSFDAYFADVRSGKVLIITRRGVPFARFEPVVQAAPPRNERSRG
jgi:prevent-host-death family protein